MSGCASSKAYVDVADFELTDLPAPVYAEAKRITTVPKGPQQIAAVKKLVVKLRRSELRKHAALNSAIRHYSAAQKYLRKRGKK